jgi:hypothetical protein
MEHGSLTLLALRAQREPEHGVQKVPHTLKEPVALGDGYLVEPDPSPKTDDGERAVMDWIYFVESVGPGRILLREQSVK